MCQHLSNLATDQSSATQRPHAAAAVAAPSRSAAPLHPTPPVNRRAPRGRRGGIFGVLAMAASLPLAMARFGVNLALSAAGVGTSLVVALLPNPLLGLLQRTARSLTANRSSVSAQEAAAQFAEDFAHQYGEHHLTWEATSWQVAAAQAHRRFCFLFVYLHSPSHPDTDEFCRSTLCNAEVVAYLNNTLVAWGGNILHSDAFRLSSSLGASSYPFCALVAFSGNRTRLIAKIQGLRTPQQLLAALRHAVDRHGTHLAVEQADHNQRDYNRRLREEQDAEYQRSLQADQAREREREKARVAAEAEAKAAAEAEQRAKAEQEAQKRAAEQAEAARLASRSRKRELLPAEPAAGSPGAAQIRVRMRDGSTHQRRFPNEIPLQSVVDWVGSMDEGPAGNFSLASAYPRKVFRGETLLQTLTQLGLAPQAVLIIHDEDE